MHPYMMRSKRSTENAMNDTTRVRWNDAEKRRVATEAFKLIKRDPTLSLMPAIALAQVKKLPEDRQRELASQPIGKFKVWITPIFEELQKKDEAKTKAEKLFEPAPAAPKTAPSADPVPVAAAAEPTANTAPESIPHAAQAELSLAQSETPEADPMHAALKQDDHHAPDNLRKMVHWTEEEKSIIARGTFRRMELQEMDRLEALRTTVELDLPEDRHRAINTWFMVEKWIEPLLKLARSEYLQNKHLQEQAREAQEQAERDRIAADEARAEAEKQAAIAKEAEIERRVAERVMGMSFDDLIGAFGRKIARQALAAIREGLEGGLAEQMLDVMTAPSPTVSTPVSTEVQTPVSTPAQTATQTDIKLPKLMVVGLYPAQETEIEKAYRGTYDLVFIRSSKEGGVGAGGHGMIAKADGCEAVLAMTHSMGLDVEQKRRHLRRPFVRIAGSVSNLKRWLTAYAAGEIELPKAGEE